MELSTFFKGIIDVDNNPIVICNVEHTIVYMNLSAINRYKSSGGEALVGKSIMCCHNEKSCVAIQKALDWFNDGVDNNCVHTFYNEKDNKDFYIMAIRDDNKNLIGYYEKHESRNVDKSKFYNFT